ncbi:hypothetical protein KRP22_006466 [Phytophthora ramorum]|uniref:PX domain-containing protein n=1 Tax=Phytophthora ramorum TaxID=164328 RepID=H3GDP5_PHYRM|nr:hypothetical protein KRP23_4368 [Phytophthora ramorum]KAH7507301.1 hypothetical protein KRP22_2403 [Phytophthora ramorum]
MPSLQQLSKVAVMPTRFSNISAPLAFLEKIHHVEINTTTEHAGVVYYQLGVYLKHNDSHIPTVKVTTCGEQPDYQLDKRFSDFASLRHDVWFHAQRKHEDGNRCEYCGDFMSYIVHSMSQPRLFVKLATSVDARKKLLGRFCNAFIENTLGDKSSCSGYQSIPHIVERFFRQDEA